MAQDTVQILTNSTYLPPSVGGTNPYTLPTFISRGQTVFAPLLGFRVDLGQNAPTGVDHKVEATPIIPFWIEFRGFKVTTPPNRVAFDLTGINLADSEDLPPELNISHEFFDHTHNNITAQAIRVNISGEFELPPDSVMIGYRDGINPPEVTYNEDILNQPDINITKYQKIDHLQYTNLNFRVTDLRDQPYNLFTAMEVQPNYTNPFPENT